MDFSQVNWLYVAGGVSGVILIAWLIALFRGRTGFIGAVVGFAHLFAACLNSAAPFRSLVDPATCQTFTEVIVTNKEKPYVLATRLRVNHDKIAEIEILWTTTGYWLFNADAYLKWSSSEKWDPIPADKRDTRDTLVAAANAYLDAFLEGKKDLVPWGYPCNRTEGGAHTGNGSPTDSCDVGVPSGVNIANRRFVVDDTVGSVAVFCTFGAGGPGGGSGAPDTHLFRVENGKLRYVHTLTHLLQANFQGGRGGRAGGGGRGAGPGAQAAPTTP